MRDVTAYEIKEALSKKHRQEFFITECKNGPTGVARGELLQFDGVAIYKSWAHPEVRGYEIKVSRSDFLRDAKYPRYRPYFHEFYFVVPQGMVKREELDEGIGLMYYNPDTGAITTKKKAVHQKIELDANFLYYIIMCRLDSDRAPFMLHKEEAFKAWFDGKQSNRELSYRVKSKLLSDNVRLEEEIKKLKRFEEDSRVLHEILAVMGKHGIKTWGRYADALDGALKRTYPPELDSIRSSAQSVVTALDMLKFRIEKENQEGEDEAIKA